ncbi:MAG: hypothetical protein JXR71_05425 [Bacteroidales bacterium]|nr:hypothetical protein [Bacteroidales bacterium]
MKKLILNILLFSALSFGTQQIYAQTAAAPPPPSDHGTSTDQTAGGGAPIGSGLFILLGLAGTYGAIKVYQTKKKASHVN